MSDCTPNQTPLPVGLQLVKIDSTPVDCKQILYRSAIGKLLYVAIASQPNIVFAVTYLCQFANAYNKSHWNAIKHLLWYLKGTMNQVLCYRCRSDKFKLSQIAPIAYCNSNFAGDSNECKSISVYIFMFANGPISWNCAYQKVVALSSTKAKYITLTHVSKQVLFSHKLLTPLRLNHVSPTLIYSNSQSTMSIANSTHHNNKPQLKHFNIKVHFIHNNITNGTIHTDYCPTNNMITNYLTKLLSRLTLKHLKALTRIYPNKHINTST
jgi:hypothetical protein